MLAWMGCVGEARSLGAARSSTVLGMLGAAGAICLLGRIGYGGECEYIAALVSNAWNA